MATCPRCGNDAEPLAGDTIDATDLAPREDVGRTNQQLLPAPARQPHIPPPYDAQVA